MCKCKSSSPVAAEAVGNWGGGWPSTVKLAVHYRMIVTVATHYKLEATATVYMNIQKLLLKTLYMYAPLLQIHLGCSLIKGGQVRHTSRVKDPAINTWKLHSNRTATI